LDTVSVALAHPDLQQRIDLKKMLFEDPDLEILTEIEDFTECVSELKDHQPDLLLLSLELASAADLEELVREVVVEFPQLEILLLSPGGETDELARKLVRAGAFDYLNKPCDAEELVEAVVEIVETSRRRQEKLSEVVSGRSPGKKTRPGKVISVFSTKGGVGRSLFAVNLACSFRKLTKKRVALVDLDLQFGDDAILMDMKPTTMIATLARDCKHEERVGYDLLENYMHTHEPSGVDLLPSPPRPEEAEYVEAEDVHKIVAALRRHYDYVIVDTSSHISEPMMVAVEESDLILLLLTLELPTIKNGKLMLELMENIGLSEDHIRIVMNRDVPDSELQVEEVEEALGRKIIGRVPSQGNLVMPSIDEGTPLVLSHPESDFARHLFELTEFLVEDYFDREEDLVVEEEDPLLDGGESPPLGQRIAAGVVDHAVAGILWLLLGLPALLSFMLLDQPLGLLIGFGGLLFSFLPPLLYFSLLHVGGQPLGKRLMGLRLSGPEDTPVLLGVSFLRALALLVSLLPLGLGYLWILIDEKQRAWHDLIAGTTVVIDE